MSDSKIKAKYIIDNEQSIRQHSQYMQLCQEKSDVLNSEPLTKIISLSGTIEKQKANNLENKDQCDQVNIVNEIIFNILKLLSFNKIIKYIFID